MDPTQEVPVPAAEVEESTAPAEAEAHAIPEPEAAEEIAPEDAALAQLTAMYSGEGEGFADPNAQSAQYTGFEGYQGYQEPQPQPAQDDPLADDPELSEYINAKIEAGVNARFEEMEPLMGLVATEYGERHAQEKLGEVKARIGEFDGGEMAEKQVFGLAHTWAQQGYPADQAIEAAAVHVRNYEKSLQTKFYERYEEQLRNGQSAAVEPGVAGAAAETSQPTNPGSYDEVVARWRSGRNPEHAAG